VAEEGKRADTPQAGAGTRGPSRREFLETGARAVSGLAMATAALEPERLKAASVEARPNFLFLLGEGVRSDELSSTGNKIISTPHLDRIGREGITFQNMFVVNALCLPSRATFLTGLYSHSTGCVDNRRREIPEDIPTLAELLQEAGYEAAFFGKIHIRGSHLRHWDYYFGIEEAGANFYHPVITESERGIARPPKEFHGYVDDIITDRALAWMNKPHSKPFCLFLWFIAPHAPFYRPRRYLDLYNGIPIPKPATFDADLQGYPGKPLAFRTADNKIGTTVLDDDDPRSLEELVKDHYAGVVANDDCARRLFEALARAGKLDDTAILFSSDHGFFLGEWRFYDKRFMHEPSIRVPLMIRYPRLIQPGAVTRKMALNLDLAPTVLEMAGLKVPAWMQGRSLVPFFKGGAPAAWREDWLYEYYEYPGEQQVRPHRGIRSDRYKLIHYYLEPEEFELYDLQEDPGEIHNLYTRPESASLVAALRHRLEELRGETGDMYNYETPAGQTVMKQPS